MSEKSQEFRLTSTDFSKICELIRIRAGIKLTEQKQQMVYSRLSRRVRTLGLNTFEEYLDFLENDRGSEWEAFVSALTTHLTSFFREQHHFPILARHIESGAKRDKVALWSCAASTGEEPYSMAITAAEQFCSMSPPVSILATDVDNKVLETARKGVYPLERVRNLPERIIHRYFLQGSGSFGDFVKIRPELQRLITFMPLNLLNPSWPMKQHFDAIFCRNVMIYFDQPTQLTVLKHCLRYLKPGGLFFAGHSESLHHAAELFEPCGNTVYRPFLPYPAPHAEPAVFDACFA